MHIRAHGNDEGKRDVCEWRTHVRMHVNGKARIHTGKRQANGLALVSERPKKIHNPLFYVPAYCVRADARAPPTLVHVRLCACVCVYGHTCRRYVIHPSRMYEYIGLVRVRVCLHTTFPMYTGIWVSVFLESGFSSLDSPFPTSIFLDFVNSPPFFVAKVNHR